MQERPLIPDDDENSLANGLPTTDDEDLRMSPIAEGVEVSLILKFPSSLF
jgi:hypothetical protein